MSESDALMMPAICALSATVTLSSAPSRALTYRGRAIDAFDGVAYAHGRRILRPCTLSADERRG